MHVATGLLPLQTPQGPATLQTPGPAEASAGEEDPASPTSPFSDPASEKILCPETEAPEPQARCSDPPASPPPPLCPSRWPTSCSPADWPFSLSLAANSSLLGGGGGKWTLPWPGGGGGGRGLGGGADAGLGGGSLKSLLPWLLLSSGPPCPPCASPCSPPRHPHCAPTPISLSLTFYDTHPLGLACHHWGQSWSPGWQAWPPCCWVTRPVPTL